MGFLDWFVQPLKDKDSKAAQDSSLSVREQAMVNMRAARERIGEEEIQKMAASLREETMKMKAEKARKDILSADKAKVAGHVRDMLKDDK